MPLEKRSTFGLIAAALLLLVVCCPAVLAQGPTPDAPVPSAVTAEPVIAQQQISETHKFWDTENRVLFLANAAFNGADFAITRANLQNGGLELNPIVRVFGRSTPGLAVNFVGETAGVLTLSYFFHKTGHHKWERALSMVNIGASAGAVSYGLSHR